MSYDPLALRIIWNNETPVTTGLGFRNLYVNPLPMHPFGLKGMVLTEAWQCIGVPNKAVGMLILDGDVAIDPDDNRAMHQYIWSDPLSVWVAPAKIWPVSTLNDRWVWGHGKGSFSQDDTDEPDMFSFCFTYLPAELVTAMCDNGAENWAYPQVDMHTWELAQKLDITVKVARDCSPKHMHYL